jgi:hypothetical protein
MIVRLLSLLFLLITQITSDAVATKPTRSVLVVGDSLAVGMEKTLTSLAKTDGDIATVDAAVGTNTCQWSSRIDVAIKRSKPTIVIVSLGTNDAALGKNWVVKNAKCYDAVAKSVKDAGAKLLWILPPPLPERMEEGRQAAIAQAARVADRSFDSSSITEGRAGDGVHYTPLGYKSWAEKVWSWSK